MDTSLLLAFLIGVIAGLRAMIAPTAVSWAARLGFIDLVGNALAFMGYAWTPWVFTALATGELVTDKLPITPSRKTPLQFAGRMATGALAGATMGAGEGALVGGLLAGLAGAVLGTFAGAEFRRRTAAAMGNDRLAAVLEDAISIVAAIFIVLAA